ncbi:MAG: tyrosine-type recombinase/integrase [Oscillospiraceae bacterium]|nr:tyrosine-type recombinase/integrase [Oscillospiraceae bacterium]
MSKYQSFLALSMDEFITFRKASGRWNNVTYEANLYRFDRHCAEHYPEANVLTKEIVDSWCNKRETETSNSCRARISVIGTFVGYLRDRGLSDIKGPNLPKWQKCRYIPHVFTEKELANFFRACDEIVTKRRSLLVITRKMSIPVFFRLLYSSGLRTNEARLLRTDDVDLEQGILNIRFTKGYNQRFVVLHDSMLGIMKQYDTAIQVHHPNREYFFPVANVNGSHHNRKWVQDNFNELWFKYNTAPAIAYDLRHNYAIENINQWIGDPFDFHDKLLYLSKSMGHSKLESTKYYFHLVPALADILEKASGASFDDIVPEVDYATL